jgi:hypothetical protein
MPDTPYSDGFKAGMAWREIEIIKLLENALGDMRPIDKHSVGVYDGIEHAIALITEQK